MVCRVEQKGSEEETNLLLSKFQSKVQICQVSQKGKPHREGMRVGKSENSLQFLPASMRSKESFASVVNMTVVAAERKL
jgi:hypothetical protein